jgi:hypothetical protein
MHIRIAPLIPRALRPTRGGPRLLVVGALAAAVAVAGACRTEELLEVETPDQIGLEQVGNAAGAQALRASAIGTFARFYAGDSAGNGIGLNIAAGLLSDEMFAARGGTEHLDSRAQNENLFPVTSPWPAYGSTATQLVRATRALAEFSPAGATRNTQIGQLHMLRGYVLTLVGENYCNGVPLADANDLNPRTESLTGTQLYQRALVQFDSALAVLGTSAADAGFRNAARIGKARTLVDLARWDEAARVVAAGGDGAGSTAVPTSYVYNVEFSRTTIINAVFDWMLATRNFGASDREGGNGLDFVSARDPRVRVDGTRLAPGQDGTPTPQINQWPAGDSPVALATGVEARMIEAEAALRAGASAAFLAHLNEARTTVTGLDALTDPGTATAREDLLFRERAFWFWGTAHRVGDLRRLVRQYQRAPNSVWPSGPYIKGGSYGTDQVLVPAQAERNNDQWTGCTDRNP